MLFRSRDNVVKPNYNVVKLGNNVAPANYNIVNRGNNVVPASYNIVNRGNNVVPASYNVVNRGNNVVPARNNVVKPFYNIVKNRSDMAGRRKDMVFTLKPILLRKSGQKATVEGGGIQRKGAKPPSHKVDDIFMLPLRLRALVPWR